ncbi:alpha-L-arabinofuranosidase C-terminal domain-containing protein [Paenibacillus fonticola]|uniref:alpha-L-arabinofuranosidase C-terminal domain-containing protein n=1 Tax=Paenibacillus fonticola TaxID=379896 RepID=UPI0003618A45|nr:alpha-L-arabinofuranosidase C-terminal domain-containing protein [Paenibacillus fonticola]
MVNRAILNTDLRKGKINRNISGHFSEHLGRCIAKSVMPIDLRGSEGRSFDVAGTVLTGDTIDAHNTFDVPDTVVPQPFNGFQLTENLLTVELPPMSVAVLALTPKA